VLAQQEINGVALLINCSIKILSPVKKHYRMRQQIEETTRLLKQEFGWGGSSVREAKAEVAHPHLGLMAMCLARHAAYSKKQSV
jgi:hypothetical protein